jgi:hypothetical protein
MGILFSVLFFLVAVKSYLTRHLKSHDANKKKFECDLCGDKFTRPYLVKQHQGFILRFYSQDIDVMIREV